jgi:hypothetical protein
MTESNATLSRLNWRRAAEQSHMVISHMVIFMSKAGEGFQRPYILHSYLIWYGQLLWSGETALQKYGGPVGDTNTDLFGELEEKKKARPLSSGQL